MIQLEIFELLKQILCQLNKGHVYHNIKYFQNGRWDDIGVYMRSSVVELLGPVTKVSGSIPVSQSSARIPARLTIDQWRDYIILTSSA